MLDGLGPPFVTMVLLWKLRPWERELLHCISTPPQPTFFLPPLLLRNLKANEKFSKKKEGIFNVNIKKKEMDTIMDDL